jgi:tRNA(Arg) A34 adenosine deaminase TadA
VHVFKHACVQVSEHGSCSACHQLDNVDIEGDKADPSAEHFAYVWHADQVTFEAVAAAMWSLAVNGLAVLILFEMCPMCLGCHGSAA